jgi:hypothetical protein
MEALVSSRQLDDKVAPCPGGGRRREAAGVYGDYFLLRLSLRPDFQYGRGPVKTDFLK